MTPSHLTCKHIDLKPLLLWLYVIEATTFFIKSNFIDNIFQVSCVGIMMLILFARFIRLERPRVNLVLLLYVFLIITGCIPDLMSGTVPVGFKIMLSFALPLLMCLFVYNIYSRQEYLPRSLFTIPVWYGVLISIQSIILEIANFAGLPIKVWYEDIEKIGNRASVCSLFEIPMGAYAEWGSLGGKTILRIQGFYIEPSKMAMFFIIPVCFAWGLYKQTSKRRYKWAFIVCSVAFLLTMSRAGYLSMIGAILMALIYSTYKKLKKANDTNRREITTQKDIRKVLFAALLAVVAMALLLSLMVLLSNFFPDLEFLHTGITDSDGKMNLVRSETVDSNIIVDGLLEQPWGYGFANHLHGTATAALDTNLANAFIMWLVTGGIAGALLALSIMLIIMIKYCIPALKDDNYIINAVGMAFIGLAIHSLSYGTWLTPEYILTLSILMTINGKSIYSTNAVRIERACRA